MGRDKKERRLTAAEAAITRARRRASRQRQILAEMEREYQNAALKAGELLRALEENVLILVQDRDRITGEMDSLPGDAKGRNSTKQVAAETGLALRPLQLRQARELLGWPRERIAARMGISYGTIARFEDDGLFSRAFDPRKARVILEAAGIEFTEESGGRAGVRMKKAPLRSDKQDG
jgi:Helix-turn-helix